MHLRPHLLLLSTALIAATSAIAQGPPGAVPIARMAADAHPSLEVAVIKPHDPNSRREGLEFQGDRVELLNQSLLKMLVFAFSISTEQIDSAPDWADKAYFDVEGKTDIAGDMSLTQQREVVQKLLASRFGLRFHRESKEKSAYALQVAKSGPKLKPAANPAANFYETANGHGWWTTRTYTSTSIPDFLTIEQFFVHRPLVDQTGLKGKYDFQLQYTYNEINNTDPNAPPGIFTAIQEQLGLKLQPVKAPVDVLVIDRVERPSEN